MIYLPDLPAFALSPSGCTSVTSNAAVILRCALTAWCSMAFKCACSFLRPRTKAGASAASMMWLKAPLSVSMQVLDELIWIPALSFSLFCLLNMSNGSSAIKRGQRGSLCLNCVLTHVPISILYTVLCEAILCITTSPGMQKQLIDLERAHLLFYKNQSFHVSLRENPYG